MTAKPASARPAFDSAFVAKLLPFLRALRGYSRLKVSGLEHVPREGPAILVANHTGWMGLDYALAALVLHDELERTPRGLVHGAWFLAPATAQFAARVGLTKASKKAMAEALEEGHLVMLFPEGERGAFRPPSGYKLAPFARGFVRVAAALQVPVIPVAIVGGEEANPVDRTIPSYDALLSMPFPIPRNLLPRPAKWRIRFLPAIPPWPADLVLDDGARQAADSVREQIQQALVELQADRGDPFR